jgi:hypothetical protein
MTDPVEYIESVKRFLLTDSHIVEHRILKEYANLRDGYIRARLTLSDNSNLEIAEYVELPPGEEFRLTSYSYHWSMPDGKMIRRWDNTPHYPDLENFSHHIHDGDTGEVKPGNPTNIFAVLDEIASNLNK